MFTGLTGLSVNSRQLEVIGNNIANVNTTAFKSNRLLFSPLLSRSFSLGSAPSGNSGGTNPGQIGLGVGIGATQRNFNNGGISTTGISADLAIEGDGFFIVNNAGRQSFTRAGSFQFNASNDLVTPSGARVQGFLVDEQYNLVQGAVRDINIPIGVATIAEATENVEFSGNLNADGEVGGTGSIYNFALLDAGATPVALADPITSISVGGASFALGDSITLSGVERGGKVMPAATFVIDAVPAGNGTTVQDFFNWMQSVLGVVPDGGANPADTVLNAPEPGSITEAGGIISFAGNFGELNDINLDADNFTFTSATMTTSPFTPAKVATATGESVRTTFTVYDSLGTPLNVDVTMVLAQKDDAGTYWRAFLHAPDDTDIGLHLETSAGGFVPFLQFDNNGRLVTTDPIAVEMDRLNTGASDPLNFALSFDTEGAKVTALSHPQGENGVSTLASTFQDGSPLGVLADFSVGVDGVITGSFTNGLTRTLGQIVLAKFTNPEGLVDSGANLFNVGPNSGTPLIAAPLEFGNGRVIGGALELSNVDLSAEFTNMILTSTGYSAASRVITTSDQLLQQLLLLGR
jgi:flagellar hook protein FlgE